VCPAANPPVDCFQDSFQYVSPAVADADSFYPSLYLRQVVAYVFVRHPKRCRVVYRRIYPGIKNFSVDMNMNGITRYLDKSVR